MKKDAMKRRRKRVKTTQLDIIIKNMHDFCDSQDNCNNCKFEDVCNVLLDVDIPADYTLKQLKALLMEDTENENA